MGAKINHLGKLYGRLLVIDFSHRVKYTGGSRMFWKCRCKCGKETIVLSTHLTSGHTTSCGCYHKERIRIANETHGMTSKGTEFEGEFSCWRSIKTRCLNKRNKNYPRYGGRGIKICDRWLGENGFPNFVSDMGRRPSLDFSVGRKDNDGNYEPDNCRWETDLEQGQNTSRTKLLTHNGKTQCMSEWCRELGLSDSGIHVRLANGWTLDRALSTPSASKVRRARNNTQPDALDEQGAKAPEDELTD